MLLKTKIKFINDSIMFLLMMAIAGIGFIMKFVLLPGREASVVYGRSKESHSGNKDYTRSDHSDSLYEIR